MKNSHQKIKYSLLSLAVLFSVLVPEGISLAVFPSTQIKQTKPQPSQPKKKRSTWEAILTLFKKRKEPNLGSRGVCPVSPGLLEATNVIWSDRPLFLWLGIDLPLEIRLYSPFDPKQEQSILWRQVFTTGSSVATFQGIQYTQQPLESGKIYDWEIFNQSDKSKLRRSFQVMSLKERDRITGELKNLEDQLRAEKATDEEIALERSYYFAQRNLWSDALQEMYSVQTPSPDLTMKVQELLSYLCNTPK